MAKNNPHLNNNERGLQKVQRITTAESRAYASIAEVYDLMIADRGPYTKFYRSYLVAGVKSLIDIGCGTGVITAALANRLRELNPGGAARVAGLDGAPEMLEVARKNDPTVDWILSDLRDVPDCGPFDMAVSCYNTLQHVDAEGLAQAFRSIRRVLEREGRLVFDIYKPNITYISVERKDSLARTLEGPMGEELEIREDSAFDERAGALYLTWRLINAKAASAPVLAETSYCMWQHEPEVVEAALAAAGFEITDRFGDLDRSPFNSSSKKQVTVCKAI